MTIASNKNWGCDNPHNNERTKMKKETKTSWWSLKIEDYPNFKPSEADLEHIAKCITEGYDNGQLIQEGEDD